MLFSFFGLRFVFKVFILILIWIFMSESWIRLLDNFDFDLEFVKELSSMIVVQMFSSKKGWTVCTFIFVTLWAE